MTAAEVFELLILTMRADNCFAFTYTGEQKVRALPHVEKLVAAGFFADDPNDLDGSFWQAAAGEYTECREFFAREIEAFEALGEILNEIFEGE